MEEKRKSNETSIDAMDLLSLTFRSLDLRDGKPQQDDFRDSEKPNAIQREESAKKSRRRSKFGKEEASRSSGKDESRQLRTINMNELAWHDTADNCWVAIHDFVYDCTDFLKSHPGGSDVILEYAGRDATLAFIGTGHSRLAIKSLERHLIGELPPEERIFRVPNGLKIAGF